MRYNWTGGGVVVAAGLALSLAGMPRAAAQDAARMDAIERQMRSLQQELGRLRGEAAARDRETRAARQDAQKARAETQEAQRQAAAAPAAVAAATPARAPATGGLTFPNNRPTFTSPDGRLAVSLGGRVQYDVGGYLRGTPARPNNRAVPNLNTFGQNLRRARLYLSVKYDDFTVNLTPDFGGSPDGNVSLYEANLNYNPIRPLTISLGYLKPVVTLADATSSADFLFLERPAISVLATGISAGSGRSAVGARWASDDFYLSAYLTGNAFGSNITTQGTPDQTGATARLAARAYRSDDVDVHFGVSGSYAFNLRRTTANNAFGSTPAQAQTLTLSDRPGELRIDNAARLLNTGAIAADNAYVFSPEFAFRWKNFFLQGEYTRINVSQSQARGQLRPNLEFEGGYVELSYVLTGETRRYNAASAAFGRPNPAAPFNWRDGTWGAWEVMARYSVADLNSNVTRGRSQASTGGVNGGRQEVYGVGVSWYPNNLVRFVLNYNIGSVDRRDATGRTQIGERFHEVALRSQFNF